MTQDEIIRMAREVGFDDFEQDDMLERFAALVAAAERERRAFEIAECYRCGWDSGAKAEREKIARQWDELHDKYMADPLRRQMMLSYEMVANMIRGRTCSPQLIEGICPDSEAGRIVAELVQVLQEIVQKDLVAGAIKHDARAAIAKATGEKA